MEHKFKTTLLVAVSLFAASPLSCARAEDILSGVARTVEDIGGQIVGNQAGRQNERTLRRMEESVNHDRNGTLEIQTLPSTEEEGYKTLEGVYDTPVPARPKPTHTPKALPTAPSTGE